MTIFSEKLLISSKYISGLMPSLIKKSWTVSYQYFLLPFVSYNCLTCFDVISLLNFCQRAADLKLQLNYSTVLFNLSQSVSFSCLPLSLELSLWLLVKVLIIIQWRTSELHHVQILIKSLLAPPPPLAPQSAASHCSKRAIWHQRCRRLIVSLMG